MAGDNNTDRQLKSGWALLCRGTVFGKKVTYGSVDERPQAEICV